MFQSSEPGATVSTIANANRLLIPAPLSSPHYETVRHLLFSRPIIVQATIKHLYSLNYAEPNEWSKLIPTGHPNEVMAILTKKVQVNKTI